MTAVLTLGHSSIAVIVALHGTRHEALEVVRQGVAERFGGIEKMPPKVFAIRAAHGKPVHIPRCAARVRMA